MKRFDIPFSIIFSVFIILTIMMIAFSFYGYRSNKSTIEDLLRSKAQLFIETLNHSSANTLLANELFEEELILRLLNIGYYVNTMDSLGLLDQNMLDNIAEDVKVFRINIFNASGHRVMTNSRRGGGQFQGARIMGTPDVQNFIDSKKQVEIIGFKKARLADQDRYAVAVRRYNHGAIVSVIDAREVLEFRRKMGFGKLLQDIGSIKDIEYIVLQDREGVIAATENINKMTAIEDDPFLTDAYGRDQFIYRETKWQDENVLEVVHTLDTGGNTIGLFRVGVSISNIKVLKEKLLQRIIISSLILLIFGGVLINYSTIKIQRKKLIEQYKKLETDTRIVLENMSEGIIAVNRNKRINIYNKQAAFTFEKSVEKILDLEYNKAGIACLEVINDIFDRRKQYINQETNCSIKGINKIFSLNSSFAEDKNGNIEQVITIWNDITEKKRLEDQIQRQHQLNKIGELGSSVAHEIRNPLNGISVIVQRLKKEWLGSFKEEDPIKLVDTVLNEIKRINKIIEEFLRFARPLKLKRKKVMVNDFINQIIVLTESQVAGAGLSFKNDGFEPGIVSIDTEMMKQVLINLVTNSIEATQSAGSISISGVKKDKNYIITVSDTGTGIPSAIKDKIFDLYFSTKKSGSGIGLSIVHQIISQHDGIITVSSKQGKGSEFKVILKLENGA